MTAPLVRILGLLGAALLLASCSGPFFSKVEVKASPTVYAALGNAKANISDYVSVGKIRDILKSSPDVQVFDYQEGPSDTTQRFLVHYPLQSVDLDFGQYMKNLNLDSTLGQTLTPGTFTIPSVNQTKSQTGSFDLNTTLRTQVNTGFSQQTSPFKETGSSSSITATLPDVTITTTQFTSATFSAGFLNLALSMTGASAGLSLSATISLVDASSGAVITSSGTPVDIKAGGTAQLPLSGKTLPASFKVRFTATTQGGSFNQDDTVNVSPSLSSDVTVSGAAGISLSTSVTTPPVTLPVSAGGKLVSATVGTGKVDITLAALPSGWTGFSRTTTITLTQNAAPLVTGSKTDNGSSSALLSLDLAGKTLSDQDITVTATSSVTATNASFTGLSGGSVSIGVDAVVDVSLFSSITAKPGTDFKLNQVINQTISDQMIQWVQDISFDEVGVKFDITNGLPAGNDMTIVMASGALAITGQTPKTLTSGGAATSATFSNTNTSFVLTPSAVADKTSDGKPDLDFTVTITPPSWNSGAGTMVLSNITPGVSVSVGGTVSFIANWKTAHIKPPNSGSGYSGTFPSDGSKTDLSQLAKYLGTNINFKDVQAYLYLSGIPGQNMDAQVVAKYSNSTKQVALAGTVGATEVLTMTGTGPTFGTAGSDLISTTWDGSTAQKPFSLTSILNDKPTDLTIDYKFNVSGSITVNKADSGSHKIQADLVLLLPLSLVATGTSTATLGLDNPLPADDLFGRKVGGDNSSINNMLDKLVSMSMRLNLDNKTGLGLNAKLVKGTFSKDLVIPVAGGPVDLVLTSADLKTIKDTIPFNLALTVDMPASSSGVQYDLRRGGSINANITVNAVTDIDQTFTLRGTN